MNCVELGAYEPPSQYKDVFKDNREFLAYQMAKYQASYLNPVGSKMSSSLKMSKNDSVQDDSSVSATSSNKGEEQDGDDNQVEEGEDVAMGEIDSKG